MVLKLFPDPNNLDPGSVTLSDMANLATFSTIGNETGTSSTPTAVSMNQIPGFATTATAAGTTTLTNLSKFVQAFTGSTTQTVVLPVVTTLKQTGWQYFIINDSSGILTVNSSGGNLVQSIAGGQRVLITCSLLTGTTAASWTSTYIANGIPQNSQSAAYTTVLADANKHLLHPTADNNPRTFTIDSNANVAYPIGTTITFVNQINTMTIAITSDTLTWAADNTTGSRTLAAGGMATALKIASTVWIINGAQLT